MPHGVGKQMLLFPMLLVGKTNMEKLSDLLKATYGICVIAGILIQTLISNPRHTHTMPGSHFVANLKPGELAKVEKAFQLEWKPSDTLWMAEL